jgi:probable HAF family extracellular repeat protein
MKKHLIFACVTLLFATVGSAHGETHAFIWDATNGLHDLGTLGGDSFAVAVNDSGTVTGHYIPPGFNYHGFIWTEATGMVDLGIPGGGNNERATCFPTAINSAGNIVGYGRQVDGRQVAFFWSPTGGFTTLGRVSCSCDNGNTAYAINDHDQVTGNLRVDGPGIIYHAYLWSPDMNHPRDLGVIDGAQFSVGLGINNLGRIVGGSLSVSDFLWKPMGWTKQAGMRLLGVLPGSVYAQATGINDANEVIGVDFTSTSSLAFYTAPGMGLKFLKGFAGNSNEIYPTAINQKGVIVGIADDSMGQLHGVIWPTPSSTPVDLATIDPALSSANPRGINNVGQIVGEFFVQ